jgi:hypothetical protein
VSAFDLDRFAPPPIVFKLGGRTYRINGDVDVDVVARMLRIETAITDAESTEETIEAVREGRDLIVELCRDSGEDVADFKIGTQALLILFTRIVHGSSVAAAVAEAISPPTQVDPATGEPVATPDDGSSEGGSGDVAAPLASVRLSSGRSSTSDELDAGLLATGSA